MQGVDLSIQRTNKTNGKEKKYLKKIIIKNENQKTKQPPNLYCRETNPFPSSRVKQESPYSTLRPITALGCPAVDVRLPRMPLRPSTVPFAAWHPHASPYFCEVGIHQSGERIIGVSLLWRQIRVPHEKSRVLDKGLADCLKRERPSAFTPDDSLHFYLSLALPPPCVLNFKW